MFETLSVENGLTTGKYRERKRGNLDDYLIFSKIPNRPKNNENMKINIVKKKIRPI